jgi:hypothetical protein
MMAGMYETPGFERLFSQWQTVGSMNLQTTQTARVFRHDQLWILRTHE